MTAPDPRAAMLAEMAGCAYRLGMVFGAEAERATDIAAKVKWCELFQSCFFAVRVSTALELRLRQEERREAREPAFERAEPPETEPLEIERPDWEDRELAYTDRDRDRETERASFPVLLKTLDRVAADAAALPGPKPAALVTLTELLAQAKAAPLSAPARPGAPLRTHLAGSGAAATPPPRRPASNVAEVLAARRATGPPPRPPA